MSSIFDKWTDLDPALALRRIEAEHGSAIFDKFSYLDPQYAIKQIEAALGIQLDNTALDFNQLKPAIDAALASGGGGDAPEPIGIIDFENGIYSWGATTKARSDLAGNGPSGTWTFNPAKLTVNGYEGNAEFALVNEAQAAMFAGTVVVVDCTVGANVVALEMYDRPGFNTDYVLRRGETDSRIFDGNGGGAANSPTGSGGRGKGAFLVTASTQSVSDQGSEIATCDPPIYRPVEPNLIGVTANDATIIHSIKFYATDTDLSEVSAGSGPTIPAWVPANAKIHIDFLGGSPQGRAWSNGAEVAIDTLLGNDPNTESAWGETAYDPADLTADGLVYHVGSPALVNAALSKVLAGATVVARMKQLSAIEQRHWAFLEFSADGSDALEFELLTSDAGSVGHALSWNGPFDTTTAPVVNHFNGAINVTAITVTDARFEAAVNGCDPVAGSHSLSNLVAVTIDVGAGQYTALQSITIYDPLPTTAGLSELSALG